MASRCRPRCLPMDATWSLSTRVTRGRSPRPACGRRSQADLAGIDAPMPAQRGLLIEFSATFGQVAEGEHAFDRYAKAVIFDYAYDRFHQDRYGKDFWHVRVQAREDASARPSGRP